jgi:hypothetical protein
LIKEAPYASYTKTKYKLKFVVPCQPCFVSPTFEIFLNNVQLKGTYHWVLWLINNSNEGDTINKQAHPSSLKPEAVALVVSLLGFN